MSAPWPKFRMISHNGSRHCIPSSMSIGPYNDYKGPLASHRTQCLQRIRARTFDVGRSDIVYKDALSQLLNELKAMYVDLDSFWSTNDGRFLEMMMTDGWYLLLILTANVKSYKDFLCYDDDDRRLLAHINIDFYKRDMLLYTNQIPFEVLARIAAVQTMVKTGVEVRFESMYKSLTPLVAAFFSLPDFSSELLGLYPDIGFKQFHILLIYRNLLIGPTNDLIQEMEVEENDEPWYHSVPLNIPSAKNIHDARIEIDAMETTSLMATAFRFRKLVLPQICPLNEATESAFHNLIFFEQLDPSAQNLFTSFIYFFSKLIKRPADSTLLMELGVITTMWDDERVVDMFKQLYNSIDIHQGRRIAPKILEVGKNLREQYVKNLQPWKKDLYEQYLKSPWAILSVFVGFFLLSLTVFQTLYTILSYYKS